MFLKIYKILNIILTPVLVLLLIYRVWRKKEDRSRIKERFGISKKNRPQKKVIWIHAASVGETVSILPIVNLLTSHQNYFVLLTSGTVASGELIKNKLPKNALHQYLPAENYFAIRQFLKHWQPHLAIFVESEFWPCILSETSKVSKIISLNTRMSDASFKKWHTHQYLFYLNVSMIIKN